MPVKVGDRVACFWYADEPAKTVGVVKSISGDKIVVNSEADEYLSKGDSTWHIKQCRKLVKKVRRCRCGLEY